MIEHKTSKVGEMNGFPVYRIPVKELRGWGENPRAITEEALSGLTQSVEEFGLVQPIVWNRRTQRVVGGHQRLRTLDDNATTDVALYLSLHSYARSASDPRR